MAEFFLPALRLIALIPFNMSCRAVFFIELSDYSDLNLHLLLCLSCHPVTFKVREEE